MNKLKKLSLTVVLDAYVTKNAIEDFLDTDWSKVRNELLSRKYNSEQVDSRMNKYINYLNNELNDIEVFLNDSDNLHWSILGYNREFFDKNLPRYKRKIKWFHSVDRYPYDHSIFWTRQTQ